MKLNNVFCSFFHLSVICSTVTFNENSEICRARNLVNNAA